jgi:hypothetical protein
VEDRLSNLKILEKVAVGNVDIRRRHLEPLRRRGREEGHEGRHLLQQFAPDFGLAALGKKSKGGERHFQKRPAWPVCAAQSDAKLVSVRSVQEHKSRHAHRGIEHLPSTLGILLGRSGVSRVRQICCQIFAFSFSRLTQ